MQQRTIPSEYSFSSRVLSSVMDAPAHLHCVRSTNEDDNTTARRERFSFFAPACEVVSTVNNLADKCLKIASIRENCGVVCTPRHARGRWKWQDTGRGVL